MAHDGNHIPEPCPATVFEAYFAPENKLAEKELTPLDADACRLVLQGHDYMQSRQYLRDMLASSLRSPPVAEIAALGKIFHPGGAFRSLPPPGWEPLKIALLLQNEPMMAALIRLGAKPSSRDLACLRSADPLAFPHYAALLNGNGCTLRQPQAGTLQTVDEEMQAHARREEEDMRRRILCDDVIYRMPVSGAYIDYRTGFLSPETRRLLAGCRENGAPEAVYAGDGLCDMLLFPDNPAPRIDIFMKERYWGRERLNTFLNKTVAAAVDRNTVWSHTPGMDIRLALQDGEKSRLRQQAVTLEASRTVYNLIFLGGVPGGRLCDDAYSARKGGPVAGRILPLFDFSVSQIACDGEKISSTSAFKRDIADRRITPGDTPVPDSYRRKHLARLTRTHPDWTLAAEARDILDSHAIERLPRAPLRLVRALRGTGAREALWAGGSLRDIFNGKAPGLFDIFLETRGSPRRNKRFLREAFRRAGVHNGRIFGHDTQPFHVTSGGAFNPPAQLGDLDIWCVATEPGGKGDAGYAILFADDALAERLAAAAGNPGKIRDFLELLDISVSQIACDGTQVTFTERYEKDREARRVTLLHPNESGRDRLSGIRKKYPDWPIRRDRK